MWRTLIDFICRARLRHKIKDRQAAYLVYCEDRDSNIQGIGLRWLNPQMTYDQWQMRIYGDILEDGDSSEETLP